MIYIEVRNGNTLCLDPIISDKVDIRLAHQVLQEDVDAVREMNVFQFWLVDMWVCGIFGVVLECSFQQSVKTMDLVHDVEMSHVCLWPQSKRIVEADCDLWVSTHCD